MQMILTGIEFNVREYHDSGIVETGALKFVVRIAGDVNEGDLERIASLNGCFVDLVPVEESRDVDPWRARFIAVALYAAICTAFLIA